MKEGVPEREAQALRLRTARATAGYKTAADAITRFGWKASTYMAHENSQNGFRSDVARVYAKAFKVSAAWLMTGEGQGPKLRGIDAAAETPIASPGTIVEFDQSEFTAIGRYDAGYSAGPGSLLEPTAEPLGFYLAETTWLRSLTKAKPEHLAIVRVDGDSMKPTLEDGDWVLVDRTQKKIAREGIYTIQVMDNAWVKRISLNLREKLVRIISDNQAIPMQELSEDDLHVVGRVVSLVARRVP